MDKATVNRRLQELGVYNDYLYRKEIKVLPQVLKDDEQLNCVFTGVHDANRKMVLITSRRVVVIYMPPLGAADIKSIGRGAITSHGFEKHFLFSKVHISAEGKDYLFTGVWTGRRSLYEWAMTQ